MIEMSWRLYVAWQPKNASKNTAPETNAAYNLQLRKLNEITAMSTQTYDHCPDSTMFPILILVHFKICFQNNQQCNGQRFVKISETSEM